VCSLYYIENGCEVRVFVMVYCVGQTTGCHCLEALKWGNRFAFESIIGI
jgi:hypothetical protein